MALYSGKFITVSPTFICVAAGEIIVVSTYVGVTVFPFLSTVATVIPPPGAFILTPLTPFPVGSCVEVSVFFAFADTSIVPVPGLY